MSDEEWPEEYDEPDEDELIEGLPLGLKRQVIQHFKRQGSGVDEEALSAEAEEFIEEKYGVEPPYVPPFEPPHSYEDFVPKRASPPSPAFWLAVILAFLWAIPFVLIGLAVIIPLPFIGLPLLAIGTYPIVTLMARYAKRGL